jgi:hypothetical protein
MRSSDASFSVRLLTTGRMDRADLDVAFAIFVRNSPPALRTKTNEIRAKMAPGHEAERALYIAALYRDEIIIGFAMFSYLPRSRLLIIDHMSIDRDQRGMAAFFVFSQLLADVIQKTKLEIDYTIIEVEKNVQFGGDETGGIKLVRLLGQVGFGEVHATYFMPNMDSENYEARFEGVLMLRTAEKIYRIRREDFLGICRSIYYEHYLAWFLEFFDHQKLQGYESHLEALYQDVSASLRAESVILVNGAEPNGLIESPSIHAVRSKEATAAIYVGMFAIVALVVLLPLLLLKVSGSFIAPIIVALLLLFAGILAASSGQAFEVFEHISSYLGGTRKSRYRRSGRPAATLPRANRTRQSLPPDQDGG